ncbi:MAG: porin PorA family protein [Candidatus Geothermincolales bacterium]
MKGLTSKVMIVLGILLILASIIWWAVAVSALVKLPDDIDSTTEYAGKMTWFVDPVSRRPLPEGQEVEMDLKVERKIRSDAANYDSSRGVILEQITVDLGMQRQEQRFAYVLDRKTFENLQDERAYAWKTDHVMDRQGSYYPFLPMDTSKDEKYRIWKNEISDAVESEFVGEEDKEGVTVYNFRGSFEEKPVDPACLEAYGLPATVPVEEFKASLKAMGVDLDGLLALARQKFSAEDLKQLNSALEAGIPLKYYWTMENETSVEPKTGVPVDTYKNVETVSMELDRDALTKAFAVFAKYASDQAFAPYLGKLSELQQKMAGEAKQKIFRIEYSQTADSVKSAVDEAKKALGKINVAKVYIPWALLIVGALLLIIGLLMGGEPAQEE